MRRFALVSVLVVAITLPAAAAQRAWKEFATGELGLIVEFPGEPARAAGVYKTALVPNGVPTHIFQLRNGTGILTAIVVDLRDRAVEGASLLEEAAYLMALTGSTTRMDLVSRVNFAETAFYGRWISVALTQEPTAERRRAVDWLQAASGVEMPVGGSASASLFYTRGRLYIAHGVNLPAGGTQASQAMRFVHSVNWNFPDLGRPANETLDRNGPPR
jgi:hypothetical protein